MPARLEFDLSVTRSNAGRSSRDGPMRLLLLGDFSASAATQRPPLANRTVHRVDVDNLDQVIKRLGPKLTLPAGQLTFTGMDDFHPDQLYSRLDIFQALRHARTQAAAGNENLLDQLLGKPTSSMSAPIKPTTASPATGIDALIRNIVAPHIVPDLSAQSGNHLATVDASIAEQMRKLLHDPAFQALESAWRGVQWLISSLELDENLQLHLFDVTRDEILADVAASQGQLAQTGLNHALADRWRYLPDGESWSLLCGLYSFGASDPDIGLLAALGLIASQAGGPFIATAGPGLTGIDADALAGWRALRNSVAAPWIGLGTPRVLLRQPYGQGRDPIGSFTFEEVGAGQPAHEELLWGHASLAVTLLIGKAFTAREWAMEPGDEREIGGMPACTFEKNGERQLQTCAEHLLSDASASAMLAAGLIPVLSHRQRNAVSVMQFQSVAEPPQTLAGPWG